jgi:hypothetical protein
MRSKVIKHNKDLLLVRWGYVALLQQLHIH